MEGPPPTLGAHSVPTPKEYCRRNLRGGEETYATINLTNTKLTPAAGGKRMLSVKGKNTPEAVSLPGQGVRLQGKAISSRTVPIARCPKGP